MNLPKYDRYLYMLFAGDAPCPPFYVGIGKHGTGRHKAHERFREKYNPAKNQFLRECKAAGIKIRYAVPETCLTLDEARRVEIELISIWGRRELGGCLFNISGGGAGVKDHPPSTRAKLSAWQRGRKLSSKHRANIIAARLGTKRAREAVEKTAAWHRGKKRSSETCAKISAAMRGKKLSPEICAERSVAARGRKRSPAGTFEGTSL
jgi:hypothetical protein